PTAWKWARRRASRPSCRRADRSAMNWPSLPPMLPGWRWSSPASGTSGIRDNGDSAMLLELAIGDAYGAGFEYTSHDYIQRHNDLSGYVKHPRHSTPPGAYTDDTQMSIAIAEAIVSGEDWTPLNLATHFVNGFKRDPRVGYAGGF